MIHKIALAHVSSSNSPEVNMKKAELFIMEAVSFNANLIVFPEFFVPGLPIEETPQSVHKIAEQTKEYIKILNGLALKYSINIVPGSFVSESENGYHNTTYFIDTKGKIRGEYRKINLSPLETKLFSPGNETVVVESELGNLGLAICYDLFNPEHFRDLRRKQAQIIVCPSFWPNGSAELGLKYDPNYSEKSIDSLTVARAFENGVAVLFCNSHGSFTIGNDNYNLLGRTQVALPFKGLVTRIDVSEDKLLIQDIDTELLKDSEEVYGINNTIKNSIYK